MQVEDQDILRKFNEEWDAAHTSANPQQPVNNPQQPQVNPPINSGQPQNLAESIQSVQLNQGPYQPPAIPTTGDKCPECNLLHPPLPPGEKCPNAVAKPEPVPAPRPEPVQNLVENPAPVAPDPQHEVQQAPVTQSPPVTEKPQNLAPVASAEPEPEPIVQENNIPTEIHVNKYLNHWGEIIQAHCKTHNITNVKRLMRHLTIEVTDFLEHNKGR